MVIATVLSMVFGELVPKNLAIANPLGADRACSLTRPVWHLQHRCSTGSSS
jgi:CBS domain containing-hemolysin-like protein